MARSGSSAPPCFWSCLTSVNDDFEVERFRASLEFGDGGLRHFAAFGVNTST